MTPVARSIHRLETLHPLVRDEAIEIYYECLDRLKGRAEPFVVQALRPFEEQEALYAQGRTKPGNIVTNARPGLSYHQYGLAVDYALILADGKTISWDFNKDYDNDNTPDFMEIVQVHSEYGWKWGGTFKSIVDKPHFEKAFGYSVRQLLALYNQKRFYPGSSQNYVKIVVNC